MASLRASSRLLSRQLKRESFSLQGLSRRLSARSLSSLNSLELEQRLKCDDVLYRSGSSNCGTSLLGIRKFITSATESQTQLEHDVSTPEQAPAGYTAPRSPLRSYSPVLSGFSVLPHPAAGIPEG
ncbi:hypothetical protein R1flu_024956 [Riccia fluitans]|uniref:Uncharacterized protein n=1 Tax=Riccia fluitans TaxID=41844 RepID=A0ABD1XWD6_9MARC